MVQIIEESSPSQRIGEAVGTGLSTGLQLLVNQKLEDIQQRREEQRGFEQYNDLLRKGFSPNEAALWMQFTEGGKTHLAKEIVERMQRERGIQKKVGEPSGLDLLEIQRTPAEEQVEEIDVGLTPREKISRQDQRYKTNLPLFQEAQRKVRSFENEGLSIQRLQELNETNQLPAGLQRWNVNLKSGELRFPFLANAETQAFVKTINDFTTKAKDSFGARVTNFELNRFMKRLPTLLNTKDGRDIILRQMEIINQINSLHEQAILDAFDQQGGVRKLDFDQAERAARKNLKPMMQNLKKEFVNLESRSTKKSSPSKLKKVKKGTPISEEIVDILLENNAGDIEKSKKQARRLGYEF